MSVAIIGLVGAFVLVLAVLVWARRQPAAHGGARSNSAPHASNPALYSSDSDSSCNHGSDGSGCDGGGGGD